MINRKYSVFFIIASIMMVFLSACATTETIDLPNEVDSNAFALNYPDGWLHQIPQTNMLFLASPEILAQEAGATVTLQRSVALSSSSNSLSEALNTYLERGPLRTDRAWDIVGELETLELDGYDTVRATVEGSEQAGTLPMRSEIYVLQAENGFYFILTLTAPIDQWDTLSPTFYAIKDSVDIRES